MMDGIVGPVVCSHGLDNNSNNNSKKSSLTQQSVIMSEVAENSFVCTNTSYVPSQSLRERVKKSLDSSFESLGSMKKEDRLEDIAESAKLPLNPHELWLAHSKLHKNFFVIDEDDYVQKDKMLTRDAIENIKNQTKDLMRRAPIANEKYVSNLLKVFSLEELYILNKLFTAHQNEDFTHKKNGQISTNYETKLQFFQQERESWSIVFNRYKNFDSLLSNAIELKYTEMERNI